MATDMRVYNEIAARYGVDPKDDDAVDAWFLGPAQKLPAEEREAILDELISRDGDYEGKHDGEYV